MSYFKNKVAVITGAASGIGRELAIQLAKKDCFLAICDKNEQRLNTTSAMLDQISTGHLAHLADVSSVEAMKQFSEAARQKFSAIDVLINNAGATVAAKPFTEINIDEWDWMIRTNLKGTINSLAAFLPLLKGKDSTIVNMSSMLGLAGMTNQTAYSTVKFAIRGLSESLKMEMAGMGVHVITVHPGAVKTNFIDNSWADDENKRLIKSYIDKMGSVSAAHAAHKIIRAILSHKSRVIIGQDARRMDWLVRLLPSTYTGLILSQIRKKLQ